MIFRTIADRSELGARPLSIRRIAVTVPPENWFHGIPRRLMEILHRALVDLGLSVFRVPIDVFVPPDLARITPLLGELRAFQPELAMGLCAGNYALICRLPARRDGWRPNLFTEVLEIPTICLWEHAPLEIADQILAPLPDRPADSKRGADDMLRRVLRHERLVHWSRDSGQTRVMRDLGYVSPGSVLQTDPTLALPVALPPPGAGTAAPGRSDVGFIGHFYQDLPAHEDPELEALAADAIAAWIVDPRVALWDVIMRRITALPTEVRTRLALEPDQTFFWRFVHRLIVHRAQTVARLHMLGAVRSPIACYGNLDASRPGVPGNLRPEPDRIGYGAELAQVLARHPVTIDVHNPGIINGFSEKAILGFAAGGFVLVDRKSDWVDMFGEIGEAVSYLDADDLAAKVDRYLAHPRYRRELADAMREEIRARHSLDRILAGVLEAAVQQSRSMPAGRAGDGVEPEHPGTVVTNLLREVRSDVTWAGARVEHTAAGAVITTAPRPWSYAAQIAIPSLSDGLSEPHLRLRLLVVAGRIGVAVMQQVSGKLLSEQLVSATPQIIPLEIELPRGGAVTVILRNTVDGETRILLTEAALCVRPR